MKYFLLLLFLGISTAGLSQKEASFWYFGLKAGLDFRNGAPAPLTNSNLKAADGSATISDKTTGELLFYTNGYNTWNRFHQLMPLSRGWSDTCASFITQSALIVPVPENPHQYYIFSLHYTPKPTNPLAECSGGWLVGLEKGCDVEYSIVDMRLDNGKGDIVSTTNKVFLQTNATEKLTAIPHSNGRDYWVLTHAWNSDAFYVYLVSPAGISNPIITHIGSKHQRHPNEAIDGRDREVRGSMKASPNGRKLACAVNTLGRERPVDLFDFNPETGSISNYLKLDNLSDQYGVSFSPDNSKLYISTASLPVATLIKQYNLEAGSPEAIIASGTSIIRGNPNTNLPPEGSLEGFNTTDMGLQLGLDGKIYATANFYQAQTRENGIMVVINRPNELGFKSDIQYKRLDFGAGGVWVGLPNFIQSYFNNLPPVDENEIDCNPDKGIVIHPNPMEGKFKIALNSDCYQIKSIAIYNCIGQLINSIEASEIKEGLNSVLLSAGLYIFQIKTNAGVVTKKIIQL